MYFYQAYAHYPWKLLLKSGTEGVAISNYGRNLMKEMMLVYDGNQHRYAQIAGHGFRILAEAMEKCMRMISGALFTMLKLECLHH